MVGFSSPFGGGGGDGGGTSFDAYDEFVPANVPEPGRFLDGHDVLTGDDHLAFHRLTRALFEERGVYDMTFGYNLARLNCDTRHRGAGYRYARDADDPSVLRAEFTPTTPFCPQSDTLTKGSLRAWTGLADRHEYDVVRVRVDEMHHRAREINETLADMEESLPAEDGFDGEDDADGRERPGQGGGCSQGAGTGGSSRGYGADAPF
ncbi:hypothetical protein [Halosimplex salinum]|uniref:hypothetical protein n=1 Tax=Halosimplex salinum TaxID=1710538 RepID=UPI000F484267|nr:hypothetical protein [Halosimplex salinum]